MTSIEELNSTEQKAYAFWLPSGERKKKYSKFTSSNAFQRVREEKIIKNIDADCIKNKIGGSWKACAAAADCARVLIDTGFLQRKLQKTRNPREDEWHKICVTLLDTGNT